MRNQITYKYSNKHQHQQLDHFQNQHSTSSTHLARQQMEGNPINKNYIYKRFIKPQATETKKCLCKRHFCKRHFISKKKHQKHLKFMRMYISFDASWLSMNNYKTSQSQSTSIHNLPEIHLVRPRADSALARPRHWPQWSATPRVSVASWPGAPRRRPPRGALYPTTGGSSQLGG